MPVATPKIPGAPHSTPISTRGGLRAPIHNPYDKFSQPEFDAWIGDIKCALKRALGHEEQPVQLPISESLSGDISAYADDVAEDSFAEIKARRAAKGKQRATYEDEEDEEELEVESSILFENRGEDEDEEDEEDVDSNDDPLLPWHDERRRWGRQGHEQSDEEADDDASGEEDGASFVNNADEPIEISSDEEYSAEPSSSPRKVPYEFDDLYEGEDVENTFEDDDEPEAFPSERSPGYDEEEDELEEDFAPSDIDSDRGSSPVEAHDNWQGPRAREAEEDDDETESLDVNAEDLNDPAEDDNLSEEGDTTSQPPVELPDKWSGPRTYAQDFYAGGDQKPQYLSGMTPNQLTPAVITPRDEDDVGMVITPGVLSSASSHTDEPAIDVDLTAEDEGDYDPEIPTFHMPLESDAPAAADNNDYQDTGVDRYADLEDEVTQEEETDLPSLPRTPERGHSARPLKAHDRSLSPARASPSGHYDWNYPPAFPAGRPVPSRSPLRATLAEADILEISDDEGDEPIGPAPLGTSDLDIPTDAPYESDIAMDLSSEADQHSVDASFDDDIQMFPTGPVMDMSQAQRDSIFAHWNSMYFPGSDFEQQAGQDVVAEAVEEHREPVVAPGTDFGDFPSATPDGLHLDDETELLNDLVNFPAEAASDDVQIPRATAAEEKLDEAKEQPSVIADIVQATSAAVEPTSQETGIADTLPPKNDSSMMSGITSGTVLSPAELRSEETLEVQGITEEFRRTDEAEAVSDPERPSSAPEASSQLVEPVSDEHETSEVVSEDDSRLPPSHADDYVVTEPDTIDDVEELETVEVTEVTETEEVVSIEAVEIVVEEPITEGRRTEEPESWPNVQDISDVDADRAPTTEDGTTATADKIHGDNEVAEISFAMDVDSSHQEVQSTIEPNEAPADQSSSEVSAHDVDERGGLEPDVLLLQPGVPMPVSADPTIPDPASFHDTPMEVSSPDPEPVEDEADSAPVNVGSAIPPSLLKSIVGHRTISGLFTPMSDEPSSPASPVAQDIMDDSNDHVDEDPFALNADSAASPAAPHDPMHENAAAPVLAGPVMEDAETTSTAMLSPVGQSSAKISPLPGFPHSDDDADADGDIDPDYDPDELLQPMASSPPAEFANLTEAPALTIPAIVVSTESQSLDAIPEEQEQESTKPVLHDDRESSPAVTDPAARKSRSPSPYAVDPSQSPKSDKTAVSRSQKRKRLSPAPSGRLTRSRSKLDKQEDGAPESDEKPEPDRSKGKQRAMKDDCDGEGSGAEAQSVDNTNGEDRTLRNRSRASSIASTTKSELSVGSIHSPTLEYQGLEKTVSLPLMHAHGANRQNGIPVPPPATLPKSEDRSRSPAVESVRDDASEETVVPSTSPVTRSNCRFHKISIPQEGRDTRVYFVVPGCSLHHELMEDEDIQDHGDATGNDSQYLQRDVESLGLDPYVIGLLRQLVGVDLLREQEVFYMTPEGEPRRQSRKSFKPRLSNVDPISARISSSAGPSISHRPAKSQASSSVAGSRSASVARSDQMSRRSTRSTATSISDNDASDVESRPVSKRPRGIGKSKGDLGAGPSGAVEHKRPARRSRRLQHDAFAYNPSETNEEQSSDDETKPRRGKRRGLKRSRTAEAADEPDAKTKKRRIGRQTSTTPSQ